MEEELDMNNPLVAQMLRGERPEEMSYDEFKIKRKAVEKYLKKRAKGRFVYVSKEADYITDEEGNKKKVIKSYGPYRRVKKATESTPAHTVAHGGTGGKVGKGGS